MNKFFNTFKPILIWVLCAMVVSTVIAILVVVPIVLVKTLGVNGWPLAVIADVAIITLICAINDCVL